MGLTEIDILTVATKQRMQQLFIIDIELIAIGLE